MDILITPRGAVRCVYDDTIDLSKLGRLTIRGSSSVEPGPEGDCFVDLGLVDGPILGPFVSRSAALTADGDVPHRPARATFLRTWRT